MNGRDYGTCSIAGSAQWQERALWILCYIRRMAKCSLRFGSPEVSAVGIRSGLVSDDHFWLKLVSNQCSSVIMANVSPLADFAAGHRSFPRTELYGGIPECRGPSPNRASFSFSFMLTGSQGKLQYHAEQICGIAQSEPEGSCRVNSVQPLYYGMSLPFLLCCPATKRLCTAGCCFSKTEQRNAVALLLESIEEDLGWAAKYRANDLYRQWGWWRSFLNS